MSISLMHKFKDSYALVPTPDQQYLVRFTNSKIIKHSSETFEQIAVWKLKYTQNIAMSPNSKYLAATSLSSGLYISVFDLETDEQIIKIPWGSKNGSVSGLLSFTPDNSQLMAMLFDSTRGLLICRINIHTGLIEKLLHLPRTTEKGIQYCPLESLYMFSVFNIDLQQSSLILWKYPFETVSYEIIKFQGLKQWESLRYNNINRCFAIHTITDLYIVLDDMSHSKRVGSFISEQQTKLSPLPATIEIVGEENIDEELYRLCKSMEVDVSIDGFFYDMSWSPSGRYLVLVFSKVVKIIAYPEMACIKEIRYPSLNFATFGKDDSSLYIGTSVAGYVFSLNL